MTQPDTEIEHIPEAVAIIMDGNGRWALRRGLPRTVGHRQGAVALERLIPEVGKLGIKFFTVYAFSTENWKRSTEEVDSLMQLFLAYAPRLLTKAKANNVRIRFIGDRTRFSPDIRRQMELLEADTLDNTGLNFVIAANYGGRDEIRRAAIKYAHDILPGSDIKVDTDTEATPRLTEEEFQSYLDTAGIPDPDLIIRTSGEMRLSNFLLWQGAYAEIVVTPCLWPDFDGEELSRCIKEYNRRQRRFGGV